MEVVLDAWSLLIGFIFGFFFWVVAAVIVYTLYHHVKRVKAFIQFLRAVQKDWKAFEERQKQYKELNKEEK